ncbi:hypothetical protein BX600DRAFT_443706 [Xylariales sp. PMI_506]|nr:hypothetical protein BX600DRAFT_443706 [Xylariales sp. PMI_506]
MAIYPSMKNSVHSTNGHSNDFSMPPSPLLDEYHHEREMIAKRGCRCRRRLLPIPAFGPELKLPITRDVPGKTLKNSHIEPDRKTTSFVRTNFLEYNRHIAFLQPIIYETWKLELPATHTARRRRTATVSRGVMVEKVNFGPRPPRQDWPVPRQKPRSITAHAHQLAEEAKSLQKAI